MNKSHRELIKERYENAVHEYAMAFCQKHGYTYNPEQWSGGNIGSVLLVSDMYTDFDDIRTDINQDAPEEKFELWYWYNMRLYELGCEKHISYRSFLEGSPLPYNEEQLSKIEEAHKRVEEAREELEKLIGETHKESLGEQTDKMNFINKEDAE